MGEHQITVGVWVCSVSVGVADLLHSHNFWLSLKPFCQCLGWCSEGWVWSISGKRDSWQCMVLVCAGTFCIGTIAKVTLYHFCGKPILGMLVEAKLPSPLNLL